MAAHVISQDQATTVGWVRNESFICRKRREGWAFEVRWFRNSGPPRRRLLWKSVPSSKEDSARAPFRYEVDEKTRVDTKWTDQICSEWGSYYAWINTPVCLETGIDFPNPWLHAHGDGSVWVGRSGPTTGPTLIPWRAYCPFYYSGINTSDWVCSQEKRYFQRSQTREHTAWRGGTHSTGGLRACQKGRRNEQERTGGPEFLRQSGLLGPWDDQERRSDTVMWRVLDRCCTLWNAGGNPAIL